MLLWPDTFNNFSTPEVAKAATEVLESAGFSVRIPPKALCCGRPLYNYGMVPTAKRWLADIVEATRDDIEAGVSLVGLEPSCLAVFRDELVNLFPHDADARRLSLQSYTFSEFLTKKAENFAPPVLHPKALVQAHCHHNAVMGIADGDALMERLELDIDRPDSGCCGMAGSFGYEAGDKYDVFIAAGERVILPLVRQADAGAIVIADGFSCREQIAQTTDRTPLHLAQVMALAMHGGPNGPEGGRPEASCTPRPARISRAGMATGLGLATALATGAALAGRTGGRYVAGHR